LSSGSLCFFQLYSTGYPLALDPGGVLGGLAENVGSAREELEDGEG